MCARPASGNRGPLYGSTSENVIRRTRTKRGLGTAILSKGTKLVVHVLVIVLLATRAHTLPSRFVFDTIDGITKNECPTIVEDKG